MMTGFAFSLVTLHADLHNSGTSLIAAMAIFFKAPTWAPSFFSVLIVGSTSRTSQDSWEPQSPLMRSMPSRKQPRKVGSHFYCDPSVTPGIFQVSRLLSNLLIYLVPTV